MSDGASGGVLRVVQLNAGSLIEPDWTDRRHEIVAWLERLRADVVCLEEIWQDDSSPNTAEWIAAHTADLGYHCAFGGAPFAADVWPDRSLRFGSAVLSRWPIDDFTHHALPIAPGGNAFVQGVPWELVHASTAGLDVFACHLAAAPTDGVHRRLQVLTIDDLIREARGDRDTISMVGPRRSLEDMPVILCGDFNAEPESDEVRFLCSLAPLEGRATYYQDAWRAVGDGPGLTQDWRTNDIAASMNVHPKRIDYVFVGDTFRRRDGAGRILAASLAFHEPLTGIVASDHFGVCVDLLWPQRPASTG
jgi:endonuclease/exonuclease/phosphatase family metal-dependent hydrolase